jgi:hypothetical protein
MSSEKARRAIEAMEAQEQEEWAVKYRAKKAEEKKRIEDYKPMDKHVKITLIVCISAVIVAWIIQPKRYSVFGIERRVFLIDSKSGEVWCSHITAGPVTSFERVEKKAAQ